MSAIVATPCNMNCINDKLVTRYVMKTKNWTSGLCVCVEFVGNTMILFFCNIWKALQIYE